MIVSILVKLLVWIGVIRAVEVEVGDDEWDHITSQLDCDNVDVEKVLAELVKDADKNVNVKWGMEA